MNRRRILGIAAALKAGNNPPLNGEKLGFNMRNFIAFEEPPPGSNAPSTLEDPTLRDKTSHACGAVGCIAGWAVAMYGSKEERARLRSGRIYYEIESIAATLLGLSWDEASWLFRPPSLSKYWDAGPDVIAAGLEHYVATGRRLWDQD